MSNKNNLPLNEPESDNKSHLANFFLLLVIIMSVFTILLVFNYTKRTSPAQTTKSISIENTFSYSTGGITFAIPSTFSKSESLEISEESATIILGNESLDYLWVSHFINETTLYEKIDEIAVSMVADASRQSSETTYVDGTKTFLYTYTGTMEGKQYYAHIAMILNTDNNHVIYAIYVIPSDSSRDIADFKALLNAAKETGDADSSESSKRVYYVENHQ